MVRQLLTRCVFLNLFVQEKIPGLLWQGSIQLSSPFTASVFQLMACFRSSEWGYHPWRWAGGKTKRREKAGPVGGETKWLKEQIINLKKKKRKAGYEKEQESSQCPLKCSCSVWPYSLVVWFKTQFDIWLSCPTKNCIFPFQNGCEISKCKMLREWEVSLLPMNICFGVYLVVIFALLFCSLCEICW